MSGDDRSVASAPDADGSSGDDDKSAADDADRTGPLSELAASVADGDGTGSATVTDGASPDVDDLFDRERVADVDSDRLWERLEDLDGDGAADGALASDDREIREIDKGSYCHRCEHFAAPPTVACTREGTEILELTAVERFRVADCPVALEDEALAGDSRERSPER